MTTQFDRTLTGFRFVQSLQGDTMQEIAARELGDASKWVQIVNINDLVDPYLTGDPTQAGNGVLLYGQMLIVPAASPQVSAQVDPNAVFGTDIALVNGRFTATAGDFDTVSGLENLKQALSHRLDTETGELVFHLEYGEKFRRLLGRGNGPTAGILLGEYVNTCLLGDPRVDSVGANTVTVQGDTLSGTATVVPIVGAPIVIPVK